MASSTRVADEHLKQRRRERVRPNRDHGYMLLCAVLAVAMGVLWSLVIPPFQAHDEPAHVYFSQFLAETGQTPRPVDTGAFSPEETTVINGVRLFDVAGNLDARPPWTNAQDAELRSSLEQGLARVGQGGDAGVGSYPPLYY